MEKVELTGFVLKTKSGTFIGTDDASGGYPYETTFSRARVFNSIYDAHQYRRDEDWKIFRRISVNIEPVDTTTLVEAESELIKAKERFEHLSK